MKKRHSSRCYFKIYSLSLSVRSGRVLDESMREMQEKHSQISVICSQSLWSWVSNGDPSWRWLWFTGLDSVQCGSLMVWVDAKSTRMFCFYLSRSIPERGESLCPLQLHYLSIKSIFSERVCSMWVGFIVNWMLLRMTSRTIFTYPNMYIEAVRRSLNNWQCKM